MGGQIFENTNILSSNEYDDFINKLDSAIISTKYLLPFRLGNKTSYSDIDIIVSDEDDLINEISKIIPIKYTKIVKLANGYSNHILTENNVQIDLLKPWNENGLEITRAYNSYSFANVFFEKIINKIDVNFNLSHLGISCTSNKIKIPNNVTFVRINKNTRLILDVQYLFELMNLNYNKFTEGFIDENEFLNYLKTSKYYDEIKFTINSKFRHNVKRLEPFRNLYENNLLNVELS